MVGSGPIVFSLWPYIITNARIDDGSEIVLNPDLIASIIGCTPEEISKAIAFLCEEDVRSTTPTENGKRLIQRGPMKYFVVNLERYRLAEDQDRRRKYWKEYKRLQRAKAKKCPLDKVDKLDIPPLSHHAGTDAGTDADVTNKDVCIKGDAKISEDRNILPQLMAEIGKHFNRKPGDTWEYGEQCLAISVSKRPDALAEWLEILAFRIANKSDAYLRQSVRTVLGNWTEELDKARNHENNRKSSRKGFDRNKGTFNEGKAKNYDLSTIIKNRAARVQNEGPPQT